MIARMKALIGRLESLVSKSPVSSKSAETQEGTNAASGELARTRRELQNARRQLSARNREMAELRARLIEGGPAFRSASSPNVTADGREAPAPFFVLGPPKSGTSWLQATLNAHPRILCMGEGKFFGRNLKTDNPYGQWGAEVSAAMTGLGYQTANRASLYSALADCKDLDSWFRRNGGWSDNKEVDRHVRALVRLTLDHLFEEARQKSGKSIVGDKTPSHIQYLEEIHEFYPDAKIIHIIRDGRDQAVSSIFHWWRQAKDRGGFFPLSPEHTARRDAYYEDRDAFGPDKQSIFDEVSLKGLAENWRDTVTGAAQNGPRLFADRYFEVKYEELLINPEEIFARIIEFLDADSDPETVRQIVQENSFESRSGNRTLGTEDPTSFLRKGISGDWRNYFTERDKRIYKGEARGLLIGLGYEKDDEW